MKLQKKRLRCGISRSLQYLPVAITALALPAYTPAARAAEPQRWALLVGVGDNANASNVLRGPVNDVAAMTDLLCGRYDFPHDHLRVLLDAKATRQGILGGWDWLAQHARPGDQVVFYYSGHGIDVPDPTKSSGRDSAICPFDAVRISGLITGREIGERIDRLPTDQVTAIVDACCSATATRDIRNRRRSPDPRTFGLTPSSHRNEADASAVGSTPLFAPAPNGHPQKERYIGASRIDQSAHECAFLGDDTGHGTRDPAQEANPNMGALTYYLLKELRADPNGTLSYEALTRRVQGDLAALFTDDPQEPQVSGPDLGAPFLAVADTPPPSSSPLPVAAARSAGRVGATVTLRALAGASLAAGSILQGTGGRKWNEVSESSARDPAESGAVVRVTSVTGAAATGAVIAGSVYAGAPLAEVSRPEPDGRLRVVVNGTGDLSDRLRRAAASVANVLLVASTQTSDVTLYPSAHTGRVDLYRRGVAVSPIQESQVPATLLGMQRVKKLEDLQSDPNSTVHVTIETLDSKQGYSEAKIGEKIGYRIEVDRAAYLTILDIAADGAITGITIPQMQEPGTPFTLPPSLVTPPAGLDTVKVIATVFPVQFTLPGNKAECESQGNEGLPQAVARRVLGVLRAQASAAMAAAGQGSAAGQIGGENGLIPSFGWATADMLLRDDP